VFCLCAVCVKCVLKSIPLNKCLEAYYRNTQSIKPLKCKFIISKVSTVIPISLSFSPSMSIHQTKCHRYWPGAECIVYGEIAVEMLSEKEKEDWTVREFKLSMVCIMSPF
jgi:hypothetical protein